VENIACAAPYPQQINQIASLKIMQHPGEVWLAGEWA
jgi:hypothetical protein